MQNASGAKTGVFSSKYKVPIKLNNMKGIGTAKNLLISRREGKSR